MKIGIFGGSFNPVHIGHINLCAQCADIFKLDSVLLVPTNVSPHKDNGEMLSFTHRMNMLNLAVMGDHRFHSCDIEHRLGGTSYTIITLEALREIYPNDELYLIIGEDMLGSFHKWYRYHDILNEVQIIAGAREHHDKPLLHYLEDSRIHVAPIEVVELSSTQIRENIANSINVSQYLDEKVYNYIKVNNLYGC